MLLGGIAFVFGCFIGIALLISLFAFWPFWKWLLSVLTILAILFVLAIIQPWIFGLVVLMIVGCWLQRIFWHPDETDEVQGK